MKRLVIAALLLRAATAGAALDGPWWPATNSWLYTNALAHDVFSNVLWRCYAVGQTAPAVAVASETVTWNRETVTNLVFTNRLVVVGGVTQAFSLTVTSRVAVATNVTLTNCVAGFTVDTPEGVKTGRVTVAASLLEQIDDALESILDRHSLPYYAHEPDYSFDDWFQCNTGGAPMDAFPLASKADLFQHYRLGMVHGPETNWIASTNYLSFTNYGGRARWLKRRDRPYWWRAQEFAITIPTPPWTNKPNPAQVTIEAPAYGMIGRYPNDQSWDYDHMVPGECLNEFACLDGSENITEGESYLHAGVSMPSWVVRTPSNAAFTLRYQDGYFFHGGGYWTNENGTGVVKYAVDEVPDWALTAPTTMAERAWMWLTVGTYEWTCATNIPGTSVILLGTNRLTAYEGTKRWGGILYPEQLDERRMALTNLFLVPWDRWKWTNTQVSSIAWASNRVDLVATNFQIDDTNEPLFRYSGDTPPTNGWEGPWWTEWPDLNIPWWLTCAELTGYLPQTTPSWVPGSYTPTNDQAPSFDFSASVNFKIQEEADAIWAGCFELPEWSFWRVTATRDATNQINTAEISGVNYKSQVLVTNLWTGALHRAHFYEQRSWDTNNPFWHRVEISDWTLEPVIASAWWWDASTNMPSMTATNFCDDQPYDDCCDDYYYETNVPVWDYEYACSNLLTTNWVTTDVWYIVESSPACTNDPPTWTNYLYQYWEVYTNVLVPLEPVPAYYTNIGVWASHCTTNLPTVAYTYTTNYGDACPTDSDWVPTNEVALLYWYSCDNQWSREDDYIWWRWIKPPAPTNYTVRWTPYLIPPEGGEKYNKHWPVLKQGSFSTNTTWDPGAKVLIEWRY